MQLKSSKCGLQRTPRTKHHYNEKNARLGLQETTKRWGSGLHGKTFRAPGLYHPPTPPPLLGTLKIPFIDLLSQGSRGRYLRCDLNTRGGPHCHCWRSCERNVFLELHYYRFFYGTFNSSRLQGQLGKGNSKSDEDIKYVCLQTVLVQGVLRCLNFFPEIQRRHQRQSLFSP